jgi:hypothetical protein
VMRTSLSAGAARLIRWLRDTWTEVDSAQRRMIELQLGMPPAGAPARSSEREELERVYALPSREPDHGLGS